MVSSSVCSTRSIDKQQLAAMRLSTPSEASKRYKLVEKRCSEIWTSIDRSVADSPFFERGSQSDKQLSIIIADLREHCGHPDLSQPAWEILRDRFDFPDIVKKANGNISQPPEALLKELGELVEKVTILFCLVLKRSNAKITDETCWDIREGGYYAIWTHTRKSRIFSVLHLTIAFNWLQESNQRLELFISSYSLLKEPCRPDLDEMQAEELMHVYISLAASIFTKKPEYVCCQLLDSFFRLKLAEYLPPSQQNRLIAFTSIATTLFSLYFRQADLNVEGSQILQSFLINSVVSGMFRFLSYGFGSLTKREFPKEVRDVSGHAQDCITAGLQTRILNDYRYVASMTAGKVSELVHSLFGNLLRVGTFRRHQKAATLLERTTKVLAKDKTVHSLATEKITKWLDSVRPLAPLNPTDKKITQEESLTVDDTDTKEPSLDTDTLDSSSTSTDSNLEEFSDAPVLPSPDIDHSHLASIPKPDWNYKIEKAKNRFRVYRVKEISGRRHYEHLDDLPSEVLANRMIELRREGDANFYRSQQSLREIQRKAGELGVPVSKLPPPPNLQPSNYSVNKSKGRGPAKVNCNGQTIFEQRGKHNGNDAVNRVQGLILVDNKGFQETISAYEDQCLGDLPFHIKPPKPPQIFYAEDKDVSKKRHIVLAHSVDGAGRPRRIGAFPNEDECNWFKLFVVGVQSSCLEDEMQIFDLQRQFLEANPDVKIFEPMQALQHPCYEFDAPGKKVTVSRDGQKIFSGSKRYREARDAIYSDWLSITQRNKEVVGNYARTLAERSSRPIELTYLSSEEKQAIRDYTSLPNPKEPRGHGFWYRAWRSPGKLLTAAAQWIDEHDMTVGIQVGTSAPLYEMRKPQSNYSERSYERCRLASEASIGETSIGKSSWEAHSELQKQTVMARVCEMPQEKAAEEANFPLDLLHPRLGKVVAVSVERAPVVSKVPHASPKQTFTLWQKTVDVAKEVGAFTTHQLLDGMAEMLSLVSEVPRMDRRNTQNLFQENVALGHRRVDTLFGTTQAVMYTPAVQELQQPVISGSLPPPTMVMPGSTARNASKYANKSIQRASQARSASPAPWTSRTIAVEKALEVGNRVIMRTTHVFETRLAYLNLNDHAVKTRCLELTRELAAANSCSSERQALREIGRLRSLLTVEDSQIIKIVCDGKNLAEIQIRTLFKECGLNLPWRPMNIPQNSIVRISSKGGGLKYIQPGTTGKQCYHVRIMPGDPTSPNPLQQRPYAVQRRGKIAVGKDGSLIHPNSPEAHIPIQEFEFKGW